MVVYWATMMVERLVGERVGERVVSKAARMAVLWVELSVVLWDF